MRWFGSDELALEGRVRGYAGRMERDAEFLAMAARAALRAAGDVEPNPLVGAVVVRDGRVIGAGHHRRFGGAHAEREALEDARCRGEDVRGATLYCTLEPCVHFGKTPPCVDAVIAAGIVRVVIARLDPHARASGGAEALRKAGIEVEVCGRSGLARRVSEPFVTRIELGRPYVIAKWAQTIDGRVATASGESRWISGEASRRRVHRLRGRVDAIVTGVGTVLADDPMLTSRGAGRVRRVARRVVLDSRLRTPLESAVVRTAREVPTVVCCVSPAVAGDSEGSERARLLREAGVEVVAFPAAGDRPDVGRVLGMLADRFDATNVLVEAGPGVVGSLLGRGLVDEVRVYIGPMVLGDETARPAACGLRVDRLGSAARLGLCRVKRLGDDVELVYARERG